MKKSLVLSLSLLTAIILIIPYGFTPSWGELKQSITGGVQAVDLTAQEAKFEEYRTVPRGLFLEEYRLQYRGPDWNLDFGGDNLLRTDQAYNLSFKGPFEARLTWDQIPHVYSLIAKTIFSHPDAGTYTLPDDLQTRFQNTAAAYTTEVYAFASTAEGTSLATRRDKAAVELEIGKGNLLGFDLAVEQERKTGNKAIGASLGFAMMELPEPIDYNTSNIVLRKEVAGEGFEVEGSYRYSNFQNNVDALLWDNPRRISDTTTSNAYSQGTGSATGKLDLSPNNLAHEAVVNAGADLPLNGRFNGSIGYTTTRQNDAFLPYTTNTAIIPGAAGSPPFDASQTANLPAASASGRIDTLVQQYLLNLNPLAGTRVALKYRSAKVDNKTPALSFPGHVRMDQVWEVSSPESHPFGNEKTNYDLDLSIDLLPKWTLGLGYGIESIDRTYREVKNTRENVLRASLRGTVMPGIIFSGSYLSGNREMDDFHLSDYKNAAGTLIEHPGLRRSDVADRDRKEYNAGLNLAPSANTVVGLSYRSAANDFSAGKGDLTGGQAGFTNNLYGLLSQRQDGLGVNADLWLLDETLLVSLFYDNSTVRYSERSNLTGGTITQTATNDWTGNITDNYNTVGVEVSKYLLDDRLTAGISYWLSLGTGKIELSDVQSTAAVETSPPDTKSLLTEIAADLEYKLMDNLSLLGRASVEQFETDDFAVNSVPLIAGKTAAGVNSPNAIYLGDSLLSYKATRVQVAARYTF